MAIFLPIITRLSRDQKQIKLRFFLGYVYIDVGKYVYTESAVKKHLEYKDSSEMYSKQILTHVQNIPLSDGS